MIDRPTKELRRRWDFLRYGRPKPAKGGSEIRKLKPAKHVSFADPVVTGGDVRDLPENMPVLT